MRISSKKQILFLGLMSVLGLTACSKNCPQADLDSARKEGAASAAPNAAQKTLATAIRNFNTVSIQLQKVQDSLKQAGYYPGSKHFTNKNQGEILSAITPVLKKAIAILGTMTKSENSPAVSIFADGTESAGSSEGTASILIGFKTRREGNQTFTLPNNAGTIILKNLALINNREAVFNSINSINSINLFTIEVYINDMRKAENKIGEINSLPTFSLILSEALQQLKERADAAR